MRTLVALLGVVALGAAGCSALHRSGGQGTGRRFYLTVGTFPGNKVLDACAHGYHMASRFELLDVALLRYDSRVGFTTDDAGSTRASRGRGYWRGVREQQAETSPSTSILPPSTRSTSSG